MRLSASIEKNGYFWLSSDAEAKNALSGILRISPKGQVTLELTVPVEHPRSLVEQPWPFQSDDDNISFDKIIGKVEGDEFVTLCQCECLTPFSGLNTLQAAASGGVSLQSSKFISQYAIIGRNYFGEKEGICFSRCTASFEGFEELLDTGSINIGEHSFDRISMEYNRPEPVSFKILYESDEIELTLDFRPSGISFPLKNNFSLKQRTYISLSSKKSLSFDSLRTLILRINNFLCLAIDNTVSFDSVTVCSKEKLETIEDKKQEISMNLYFVGKSYPAINIDTLRREILFFYKAKEVKKFVNDLSCWMQNYEKYNIPINLYFASVHGEGNIEPKFLSLAQGIEVLHGILTNSRKKKISLADRVKEMAEEFKDGFFTDDIERETFAQNVKEERDWLTHYGWAKSPFMKDYNTRGFLKFKRKLEALFQLHLMKLAGMELERIKETVERNYRLRHKLGLTSDEKTK